MPSSMKRKPIKPRKGEKGICRLCKEEKELTKEHVPPRSAHNRRTKYTVGSFEDFMQEKNPLDAEVKGTFEQGGVGYYSYCSQCNTLLGHRYVNAYKDWVLAASQLMHKNDYNKYEYRIVEQSPNKILKQIVSMFIAIHEPEFTDANPELLAFVKDENSKTLSDKYRIFMYLNTEGMMRYNVVSAVLKISPPGAIVCSEITYPPYGYVLTFDHKAKQPILADITYFKDYEPNALTHLDLVAFRLPTFLPISLDYRSKEQIQRGINNSLENL
jgi:hypothetical protein